MSVSKIEVFLYVHDGLPNKDRKRVEEAFLVDPAVQWWFVELDSLPDGIKEEIGDDDDGTPPDYYKEIFKDLFSEVPPTLSKIIDEHWVDDILDDLSEMPANLTETTNTDEENEPLHEIDSFFGKVKNMTSEELAEYYKEIPQFFKDQAKEMAKELAEEIRKELAAN